MCGHCKLKAGICHHVDEGAGFILYVSVWTQRDLSRKTMITLMNSLQSYCTHLSGIGITKEVTHQYIQAGSPHPSSSNFTVGIMKRNIDSNRLQFIETKLLSKGSPITCDSTVLQPVHHPNTHFIDQTENLHSMHFAVCKVAWP